jgi:hypothetical protein
VDLQQYRNLLSKIEQKDKAGAGGGADVYPALAIGSGFLPSAGISDVLGYAPDPLKKGKTLPSFSENIASGKYVDAGLQTIGASGDVMLAASPFMPFLIAPAVAAKGISTGGKALKKALDLGALPKKTETTKLGALPKDKTFAKFLYHSPRGRDITEGIKKYDHADFSPDRLNMPDGKGIYLSPTPLDNQAVKIDVSKLPVEKLRDLQQTGQAEGYFTFNKDIPANAIVKETETLGALPKNTATNLHNDLNDEELITGYVNTGQSSKSGVGKNEIINRFENNPALKDKSINFLNQKNAINPETNTVTVYRAIITRGGKEIKPETKTSASLSIDKTMDYVNFLTEQSMETSKIGMFDNVFIAKYEVPKDNVIGYLPAFKNDINTNVNKVLTNKGFGQENIEGFKKIDNQSEHAKKLIDAQDEILVDVSNSNMQVMKDLKGVNKPIEKTGNINQTIQKIATGEIKTLDELNANISPNQFILDDIMVPNAVELEQIERQKFLDYYKDFFNKTNSQQQQ